MSTGLESGEITLHFSGGNHLHRRGNFLNIVSGLHSDFKLLLGSGKVSSLGIGCQVS